MGRRVLQRGCILGSGFIIHVSPLVIRPLAFISCDTLRVEINRKSNSVKNRSTTLFNANSHEWAVNWTLMSDRRIDVSIRQRLITA